MTTVLPFDILDLRHFAGSNLRSLLEEESRLWKEKLHWDYEGSANLLLQYLNSHILPGYVAIKDGAILGYIFCVQESSKAVIGDVFATESARGNGEVEHKLILHLLELLQNSPHVDRIESQLLLPLSGTHAEVFRKFGCKIYPRLFMEKNLRVPFEYASTPTPIDLELRLWDENDLLPAAELITNSYRGNLDSIINDQYCTANGSLRFLHNVVRFPGCGVFDPKASRVLVDRLSGNLAGMILCSRINEEIGHITQICIHPQFRNRGLAHLLLQETCKVLHNRGFRAVSLTVTEGNTTAVKIYRQEGFETIHAFDGAVWLRS